MAKFTVEGRGAFPLDMLRSERAWPIGPGMFHIDVLNRKVVRVELQNRGKPRRINVNRWKSFGWNVVEIDGELVK